jgi:hypothetical protein
MTTTFKWVRRSALYIEWFMGSPPVCRGLARLPGEKCDSTHTTGDLRTRIAVGNPYVTAP